MGCVEDGVEMGGRSMGVNGIIHGDWIFESYRVNTVKLQSIHSRYYF